MLAERSVKGACVPKPWILERRRLALAQDPAPDEGTITGRLGWGGGTVSPAFSLGLWGGKRQGKESVRKRQEKEKAEATWNVCTR